MFSKSADSGPFNSRSFTCVPETSKATGNYNLLITCVPSSSFETFSRVMKDVLYAAGKLPAKSKMKDTTEKLENSLSAQLYFAV